mgnify:CR=1 FL=1
MRVVDDDRLLVALIHLSPYGELLERIARKVGPHRFGQQAHAERTRRIESDTGARAFARDHRKIVFYDVSEDDPYRGMAMFTGMGIGEHYTGAHWEDRALMLQLGVAGAFVAAFFSFAGWWEAARMAGEVRDPQRTLPRAFIAGIVLTAPRRALPAPPAPAAVPRRRRAQPGS